MSEKSPLFISAMELLGHAVELLEQDNAKKNKFVILHLSNAVELLLKDMVIDCGKSIYEGNGKNTINIWAAFKELEHHKITFKQKPHLEMLVDDRNAIQHKFGYPSKETVLYYLEIVIDVFKDATSSKYDIDFADIATEYFTPSGLILIGVAEKGKFAKVDAIAKYDLLSAVATAYGMLEEHVHALLGTSDKKPVMIWHDPRFYKLLAEIDKNQLDGRHPKKAFDQIRQMRNLAVHRQHYEPSKMNAEMTEAVDVIKKLSSAMESIPAEKLEAIRNGQA